MKNSYYLLLILFFICEPGYSCGTVEGWYKYYFEHKGNDQQQLHALTFIQCEPMLKDQYKHTFEQDTMLFRMITNAFQKGEEPGNDCFTANAIKIFILFDELMTLQENSEYKARYDEIKLRIEEAIHCSLQSLSWLKQLPYNFISEKDYCEKIKRELQWMK